MRSMHLDLWLTHKQLLDFGKTTSPSFLRSEMAQVKHQFGGIKSKQTLYGIYRIHPLVMTTSSLLKMAQSKPVVSCSRLPRPALRALRARPEVGLVVAHVPAPIGSTSQFPRVFARKNAQNGHGDVSIHI